MCYENEISKEPQQTQGEKGLDSIAKGVEKRVFDWTLRRKYHMTIEKPSFKSEISREDFRGNSAGMY